MLRPLSRRIRRALTSHGRVFLVFVGVSFTVCIVLLIIAIRNIEQERDLRDIQIQDRLTYTANMIKDHVESDIRHIREELYSLNSIYSLSAGNTSFTNSFRPRPHIIYIVSNPLSVQTRPDSILTYPPVIWEGTPPYGYDVLPDGSLYERNQNWRLAVEYYKRLRRTDEYREVWDAHFLDPRVQLLSEIRLARNAAKDGNIEEALQCYGALRDSNTHLQVGIPVGMLARYARCLLFDNLGRIAERNSEARSLIQCLENGDYTLTYTSYRYYLDATHELLGSDVDGYTAEADSTRLNTVPFPIDEAVNWAWHDWLEQRRTLSSTDMTYSPVRSHLGHATICWAGTADNMVAILAPTPVYIDEYFPQLLQIPSEHLTIVQITDAEGRILAGDSHVTSNTRSIQISLGENLPWNVTLRPTAEMMSDNHTMKRQTTLLIIIGMLVVSMLVSGYALSRTITHELAAIKIKSDFISTVSHELRSPLTTIRQLSELLEDGRFKDEYERADYLGSIQHETKRLQNLIEDLLSFRSMEVAAYRLDRQSMNLVATVKRTIDDFKAQHPDDINHIIFTASRPDITIVADQGALDRAIRNLLDNAVKYSPDEVRIDVAISEDGDAVTIDIADQGIGIPENEQGQIFDQFMRGQSARDLHAKGTGIGLSIVRRIIEAHEGTIQVTSTPGEGSVFAITLPRNFQIS